MVWAPTPGSNGSGYTDELVQIRVNNNLDDPMMSQTMLPLDYPMEMYPGDHWVLQDANYNVLGLVARDGKLVERYEYSPYGERKVFVSAGSNDPGCYAPTTISGRRTLYTWTGQWNSVPVAVPDQPFGLNEFGHQGLLHEEEADNSRLIQNRHRVLHASLGRFIQRDPLGYVDGMSLYQYVKSDPLNKLDPTGKLWNIGIGAVVGGILGGINAYANGQNVAVGMIAGAVGGAVSAALLNPAVGAAAAAGITSTMTAITVGSTVAGAAGGFTSGIISETINTVIDDKHQFDLSNVMESTIAGAIGGAVSGLATGVMAKMAGENIADFLGQTSARDAGRLVDQINDAIDNVTGGAITTTTECVGFAVQQARSGVCHRQ